MSPGPCGGGEASSSLSAKRLLALGLYLRPGVAQGDDAVEDGTFGGRVLVDGEVADALELELRAGGQASHRGLEARAGQDLFRLRVEVVQQVAFGAGIGPREEMVVKTHLRGNRLSGGDPVHRRLG